MTIGDKTVRDRTLEVMIYQKRRIHNASFIMHGSEFRRGGIVFCVVCSRFRWLPGLWGRIRNVLSFEMGRREAASLTEGGGFVQGS